MTKEEKIIFACGGTLGHILPAISMIKELRKIYLKEKIILIMTTKEKQYEFINNNRDIDEIYYYDIDGFNRKKLFRNIIGFLRIIKNSKRIKKVIKNSKLVIGMGGYISAVVLKLAHNLGIKTIIHEQNKIMGLANKMCLPFVDLVLCAFPLENVKKKTVMIGNPRMIEAFKKEKNVITNNHIVVTSGTLGSKTINDMIVRFLLDKRSHKYYTTLVKGKKYYDNTVKILEKVQGEHFVIKPFENDLLELLSNANIVISRAGAGTIFEIIGLAKPSILIPSPNVTNNHQYYNALYISQRQGAKLLEEKDLTIDKLCEDIKEVINNSIIQDNLRKIRKEYNNNWIEEVENVRK